MDASDQQGQDTAKVALEDLFKDVWLAEEEEEEGPEPAQPAQHPQDKEARASHTLVFAPMSGIYCCGCGSAQDFCEIVKRLTHTGAVSPLHVAACLGCRYQAFDNDMC